MRNEMKSKRNPRRPRHHHRVSGFHIFFIFQSVGSGDFCTRLYEKGESQTGCETRSAFGNEELMDVWQAWRKCFSL